MEIDIKEKAKRLIAMSQHNFSNRVLSETCHFEDLAKNPDHWHYITDNYDSIMDELKKAPNRASSALATLATSGCFKSSEFYNMVEEAKKASPEELKEFLELREKHVGGGLRMIDYMSFPLIVRMTKNIPSAEKINLIMTKPELLSDKTTTSPTRREQTSPPIPNHLYKSAAAIPEMRQATNQSEVRNSNITSPSSDKGRSLALIPRHQSNYL